MSNHKKSYFPDIMPIGTGAECRIMDVLNLTLEELANLSQDQRAKRELELENATRLTYFISGMRKWPKMDNNEYEKMIEELKYLKSIGQEGFTFY